MAASVLVYNDMPIQERGEMLSLTDMWRASNGGEDKRPNDWLNLKGTKEFVGHIAALGEKSPSECFQALNEGGTWNTWAHWQIGMAYAKYLSPAFHAWCNDVVRAHMEGTTAPPVHSNVGSTPAALQGESAFAGELRRVFLEHVALGYTKGQAAVIAELIVNPDSGAAGAEVRAQRQTHPAPTVVPFQGGEKLINNTELARRLGILASDRAGAKRSIPYLLAAAGLLKVKGSPTLTPIGQKYGRRIRQDGDSGLRWVDPDTVQYLVDWCNKNGW